VTSISPDAAAPCKRAATLTVSPQYRVVGHRAFSHVADESLACGDSRADLQMLNLRETAHSADNLKRRLDRSFGVVLCIKRSAEKSHHLIAD
jgi:hypothetical protein